jgi:hypothetical protein
VFRALVAHLQEALHKRNLIYCVRVMSVGGTRIGVEFQISLYFVVANMYCTAFTPVNATCKL